VVNAEYEMLVDRIEGSGVFGTVENLQPSIISLKPNGRIHKEAEIDSMTFNLNEMVKVFKSGGDGLKPLKLDEIKIGDKVGVRFVFIKITQRKKNHLRSWR